MPRHIPVVDHLPPEGSSEGPVVFDGKLMVDGMEGWSPSATAGQRGADGAPGERGPQGLQGLEGPRGPVGEQGPEGPEGPRGADGTSFSLKGSVASQGDLPAGAPTGDAYFIGASLWVAGEEGWVEVGPVATGPEGPRGPQGVKGDVGEPGPRGFAGPQGETGSGGGLRHRGTHAPHGPYRAGDVVAGFRGLYMATRDIDADEGWIFEDPDWSMGDPGWVPRVLLPSSQYSFGNSNPRGIQRTASPSRAAFLSRLGPEQTSLDPAAVSLRTVSNGTTHSTDGLALEYEIPVVPGAHPVAAQFFAFNDTKSNLDTTITIQQLSDPLGASPTHASVGLGAAEIAPIDISPGSYARPVMGAHVGLQHGSSSGTGIYSSGGSGSWPRARWLGVDRGLEPLDLSSPVVTLLVTAAPQKLGSSDVTARINLQDSILYEGSVAKYRPSPKLVVHYAPDWEFLRPTAPRYVGGETHVSATAVIDPGVSSSVIQPESGSFLVPPRAVYLLQFNNARFVTEESRVSVVAPWLDATARNRLEAVMIGSRPQLAGITWDSAGGAREQPIRNSVLIPTNPPNVGVNGAMLTDCIAFRNISEHDVHLPHLASTSASGFAVTFA